MRIHRRPSEIKKKSQKVCPLPLVQVRGEVETLRGATAGGSVAASEERIRELAANLDATHLYVPLSLCPAPYELLF